MKGPSFVLPYRGVDGPWSPTDARSALSTVTIGIVILSWAWWEASGRADLDTQTGWIVVGVLGAMVVLKALFSWARAGWRVVRVRRLEVVRMFENAGVIASATGDAPMPTASSAQAKRFVAVAESSRYHRSDCLLVRGKRVKRLPATSRGLKGRQPCEMCVPPVTEDVGGAS